MDFNSTIPFLPFFVAILTASTLVFGYLWQRQTERIKIIEQQLSQNKYKAYSELVSIFYDMIKDLKIGKEFNNEELSLRLINSKKDILIYGSDKVFQKMNKWLSHIGENQKDPKHLKYLLELMIDIRKDMGHRDTKLTNKDILISWVQDEKVYESVRHYID